jgi:acetylornithine deacetylase/succinyl-diaminopimelate desuccinylase-like protein
VFAEKIIDKTKPTILVYAHYDVQPADPLNLWTTPPFEPQIRDGAIYARGANDDKGQGFMHVKAFEYLVKTNQLKCNVKFIIDGEEEIGSPSLPEWAIAHKEMLACDDILVSDTTMIDEKIPSINVGMRGLAYLEVEVNGPNKDLHSGHYGGAIANPVNVLCGMIDKLIDEKGRITVKGFYDDVVELTKAEREMLGRAPFNEEEFKHFLDIDAVTGEEGYTTMERTGIRPCLDVNGIWGGYTGEGAKTVLPSKATAKISMRIVPNQDNKKIAKLFEEHFISLAPKGVKVKVTPHHGGQGFLCPISSTVYKSAARAIGEVYGIEPVPSRGGGSIPVLADLQQILNANPLLMGFGLERDVIHSPNESYLLSQFHKGIESIALFYKYYTE